MPIVRDVHVDVGDEAERYCIEVLSEHRLYIPVGKCDPLDVVVQALDLVPPKFLKKNVGACRVVTRSMFANATQS